MTHNPHRASRTSLAAVCLYRSHLMELHDHVHASTLLIDICLAPVQHLQLLGREQSLIHAYQCVHHVPACVHEHNARRACRPASLVDVRRNVFVDMLYAAAGFDLLALDRACGCNMVAWVHLPRSCLVDLGDSVFVSFFHCTPYAPARLHKTCCFALSCFYSKVFSAPSAAFLRSTALEARA